MYQTEGTLGLLQASRAVYELYIGAPRVSVGKGMYPLACGVELTKIT